MGKRKHDDGDSDSDDKDAKKKKKKKKEKKEDKKKKKKAKKEAKKAKKKESKKAKKQQQQEESSSSDSSSEEEQACDEDVAPAPQNEAAAPVPEPKQPAKVLELPPLQPPEDGIKRFEFGPEDAGPLGVRFSGGFPPMILAVVADSPSAKKGVPVNHEVHAINGFAMVQKNSTHIMNFLKTRPVVIDVRPPGWKPKEKVKQLEKQQRDEEARRSFRLEQEEKRRVQVAHEQREREEREAAERAAREEQEKLVREEAERTAREAKELQRSRNEEWNKKLMVEPEDWRKAAEELMQASYGAEIKVKGRRGVPLRLFTRFKEVSWIWAGQVQELIGGGVADGVGESTF